MAVKKSDNGKSSLFVVGDKEAKLSIAHAMAKGYRITLDGDGNDEVVNPDGRAYYVQCTRICHEKQSQVEQQNRKDLNRILARNSRPLKCAPFFDPV